MMCDMPLMAFDRDHRASKIMVELRSLVSFMCCKNEALATFMGRHVYRKVC